MDELAAKEFAKHNIHFLETSKGTINPTELVSVIVDQENSFKEGLLKAQELIEGSMFDSAVNTARDLCIER